MFSPKARPLPIALTFLWTQTAPAQESGLPLPYTTGQELAGDARTPTAEDWAIHGQSTFVTQYHPGFRALAYARRRRLYERCGVQGRSNRSSIHYPARLPAADHRPWRRGGERRGRSEPACSKPNRRSARDHRREIRADRYIRPQPIYSTTTDMPTIRPGAVRLLGFLSHGRMGSYDKAMAIGLETGQPANIAGVRNTHNRGGVSLNADQEITPGRGISAVPRRSTG